MYMFKCNKTTLRKAMKIPDPYKGNMTELLPSNSTDNLFNKIIKNI